MKLAVIMQKNKDYDVYTFKGQNDWRFFPILKLLNDDFEPYELLNWLFNENRTLESNDWVYIQKENDKIALYDISATMDETYTGEYLVPEKRFEISRDNFEEILTKWEELRVSRLDTILLVIHEDNHVSLETDPIIIKQYQDAGYAFDIDKQ
jgi:hypothetical protein